MSDGDSAPLAQPLAPLWEPPGGCLRLKPCRHGPMLYLVNDLFIGRSLDLYGEYSEGEIELFRQMLRPGQLVLDIGANIGTHTVFLAQAVGPQGLVLSFEPQRLIFQVLCANVALNGLTQVHAHHAAVGRQPGQVRVPVLDMTREQNFGALWLDSESDGERVPVVAIDDLGLPACHFIKIDVEGMEREVLAGARETIRCFRPLLYVENEHDSDPAQLVEQLFAMDYRLYWHVTPMFNRQNYYKNSENVLGSVASFNMLGIHRALSQAVEGLREITTPDQRWDS